eukprot:1772887-Rhodomonas_salina.2
MMADFNETSGSIVQQLLVVVVVPPSTHWHLRLTTPHSLPLRRHPYAQLGASRPPRSTRGRSIPLVSLGIPTSHRNLLPLLLGIQPYY